MIYLGLLIGILIGFYSKNVLDYIKKIYNMLTERFDAHQAGVVKPEVSKMTKSVPIDLSSETGGIRRPSPNQVALDHMMEREKKIRNGM